MKLPAFLANLTRRQIVIIATIIFVIGIVSMFCAKARAADAPCPPGCEPVVAPVAKPVAKKAPAKAPVAVAKKPAADKVRPLLGFGIDYGGEHNLGAHVFGGVQFPRDGNGHNWQLQLGPTYMPHDDRDATCVIRCRECATTLEGAGPWGASLSAVVVF